MKRRILTSFILSILLVIVTACQLKAGAGEVSDHLSQNQTLRLTIPYKIKKFDTAIANDSFSLNVLSNTGEGLMKLNQKHQPIHGIAKGVSISPDQTTYTFTLRNSEWSDGTPVTAHDFELAWKRALAPSTKSPNAYLFYSIINAETFHDGEVNDTKVGIKALDDHRLQVRLKRPDRSFLSLVSLPVFYPQPASSIKANSDHYGKDPAQMLFNGPFKIQEVTSDGTVILAKNQRYWEEKTVRLQSVYFYVSNNSVQNINYYNANKIDVVRVEQEYTEAFSNSKEYHSIQTSTTQYIKFNYKNKFLQNKKIRQAISYAIDREQLVDNLKTGAEPAGALIPPTMQGIKLPFRQEAKIPYVKSDVDQAKKLFSEGLKELGLKKPPVSLIMLSYEDERKQLAVEIKEQLKEKLDLEILLNTTSRSSKLTLEEKGQFDMALSDWASTYADPASFLETFTSNHPMNTGKYSDKPFDKTIQRAVNSVLITQQMDYLKQAEEFLVVDDQALIPLYYVNDNYLVKPYVKGLVRHPFGAPYSLQWVYILATEDE